MDNTIIYLTIIYLFILRLSIIMLGGVSIVLGYRLFAKGIFPPASTGSGGNEVGAQIGSINLTFKNAAPGTFFVVLGIVLVISMIMAAPPGADFKTHKDPTTGIETKEVGFRGDNNSGECAEQCQQMATQMKSLATAMNTLAWTYNDQKNWEDASTFSEIATILDPQDASIRDTHAEMLFKYGDLDEAIKQMEKGIALENDSDRLAEYQKKLKEYKKK